MIELLIKLAKDENIHVRKASIFEGLKKIKNNSNQEIINIISDADKNIEYK